MTRSLLIAAVTSAVLTFVGVALGAGRAFAIVGIIITGACLYAWTQIRRVNE